MGYSENDCFMTCGERDRAEKQENEALDAIQREFGYRPDKRDGENWTVFRNHTLIVAHPERRPRLFKRGCGGIYYEIEPDFP